ncbi:amidase [Rhizohabitans arisaemae]|uniref:amidase n=1 Tax=Rhizohabitans arisaemae TaxID=2720610 RepID=UPI0024B1362B|nr:amidase [Rhizohabitans arisaemae]
MNAADVLDGGVLDAARALRERRVSVADLVAESLGRINAISGLNAYVDVFGDQALSLAQAHQTMLDCGYDLGPLHGIPVSLKDNVDMAGVVTTAGSAILKDNVPVADASVVSALKRAGAIVVGKNNMHEFAWGGTTANPHYGTAGNAWDASRSPAGSSGGSASAVAARTVFASIGTDTGGSVRNPAALNGVSGIRPTIGRVSNGGVFPLAWTLDTVGPIAKSSQDCAVVLQAVAGHDPRDLQTSAEPVPDYLAELERPLAGIRIGWIHDYSVKDVQPAVRTAFEAATATFESLGAIVTAVAIPDLDAIVDALVVLDAAEPSALHGRWLRERGDEYGPDVRAQLEAGFVLSAVDYVQAQRYRTHIRARFAEAFRAVDAILTPTLPFTAPRIGQDVIDIGGRDRDVHTANMQFTALASVPGLPALNVPMGFDAGGLPTGLQIITPAFEEGRALRLGHRFQMATTFHLKAPPR